MTIQVMNQPDAQIRLMLAWDYDLKTLKNEDPMKHMFVPPKVEHRRGAGVYVYDVVVSPGQRSPIERHELTAGLNLLLIPVVDR